MTTLTTWMTALILTAEPTLIESLWLEAEHFEGIRGYCWPMGRPDMKKTAGHWGLSGPGWAAEWNQGGESGFLSIATGADDDNAAVTRTVEVPVTGKYAVWVRYADWREQAEPFEVHIEQPGAAVWVGSYGEKAVIEEDNEIKLYFGWAFGWARQDADLKKGTAKIRLVSRKKAAVPRQVDVLALTTDPAYRPYIKERPKQFAWDVLKGYVGGPPEKLEPLARAIPGPILPEKWKLRTFADKGFRYLWNTSPEQTNWLGTEPNRVMYPYSVGDDDSRKEFETKYAGVKDVPIFSDPRIAPTFHGVGAGIFATDPKTGEVNDSGRKFAAWLDAHPDRLWGMMMNYHSGKPIGPQGQELFAKYRHRYLGSIAGESLGYFNLDSKKLAARTATATTRRQVADILSELSQEANAAKYRAVYGKDLDRNAYEDVISCLSVGNIVFAPLAADWGARTIGYESTAATSTVLGMRWAFMRGIARQWNGLTATYRSCNFGDSATIFTQQQSYSSPRNIFDNYYSVYAGAGMTWYKMDVWYQYMAGSSMFYHEQGFDEFWKPGGTTAAGVKDVQLSPKGKIVDRFLRVSAKHPDRGHPYTPVAFLVDYAHGWEPSPYWPNSFKNFHENPERFRYGDHERMLQEYFWTAFHPIGPESEKPMTGTNEVYVPGVFGDIFDVVIAYPDVSKWRTLDSYPVTVAAGDIELTAAEGKRLAKYVEDGGTLLVADEQLSGPGVMELGLPPCGPTGEAVGYEWILTASQHSSQTFRYRAIEGGRPLARTADGQVFCAAFDRGKGRLIVLAMPRGLGIDRCAHPVVAQLLAHLSRGLMPIEVRGEVQWLLNRTRTGWVVTLLNPAGQLKPQQGITPTDYRHNQPVRIRMTPSVVTASDWLFPDEALTISNRVLDLIVPAGGVQIVELREK